MTAPQFEALLAVQDLDTTIDQLRHRREHLPERAELSAVAKDGVTLAGRIRDAKARQDEAVGRQTAAERELADTEQRIVDIEKRMYGGTVSASRELQAMSGEVDSLKRRCSELEEHVLEAMEAREPVDAEVDALVANEADLRQRAVTLQQAISTLEAEIDRELAREQAEREAKVPAVPPDLLETYEKLRVRLDGVGAARIVNNSCSGCHLSLPATEIDRLRHEPDDTLIFCEQCGRILVR